MNTTNHNLRLRKNIPTNPRVNRKLIPINLNSNPLQNRYMIPNQQNSIATNYFSNGQRIQISKNSKLIQVNKNSHMNYYTINSKDSKQSNASLTNYYTNNNKSEISGINFNRINSNNNHSQQHYEPKNIDRNLTKYSSNNINLSLNSVTRRQVPAISNSILQNEFITGYQTSKNNNNQIYISNIKSKNRIITSNYKNSVSKIRQNYSSRINFLESKNKTKKVPMKSKIRQYKYQYKAHKPVSSYHSNAYITSNIQHGLGNKEIYNNIKTDILFNINNENSQDNIFRRSNNYNNCFNRNLYETKHIRHNTSSFDNKFIMNVFNNQNMGNKSTKNINNLNINNLNINNTNNFVIKPNNNNNNICINNIDSKNLNISVNQNKNLNFKNKLFNGKNKMTDIKIYVNEKKINRDNNSKLIQNNINNNIPFQYNNKSIYTNYHSQVNNHNNNNNNNTNLPKDNLSNHIIHYTKNITCNGMKKNIMKEKEVKKISITHNSNKILTNKPNILHKQKSKNINIIPSQRAKKYNKAKLIHEIKRRENKQILIGRKALSIKKQSKDNITDFSLLQFEEKLAQNILKNSHNPKLPSQSSNNKIINKTLNENIKNQIDDNNILIDTNLISNIDTNNLNDNRIISMPTNILNDISPNSVNIYNNINYYKFNYNTNNSTANNYKHDYSMDNNITDMNNKSNILNKDNSNIQMEKKTKIIEINNLNNAEKKNEKKISENKIENSLFNEDNLNELPPDYDENFNDLYAIVTKINFGNVLASSENFFTPEGKKYSVYKDKFDTFYDKCYSKRGNNYSNSNNKPRKILETIHMTSNTKTNSSSSKKTVINNLLNDLNIVKGLNY